VLCVVQVLLTVFNGHPFIGGNFGSSVGCKHPSTRSCATASSPSETSSMRLMSSDGDEADGSMQELLIFYTCR
jgi:hypothetical protein